MAKHSLSPVDDETHAAIIKLAGRLQEKEGRPVSIPRCIRIAVDIANNLLDDQEVKDSLAAREQAAETGYAELAKDPEREQLADAVHSARDD